MLQNAYLLAKIGADTAENERKFAEILQKSPGTAPRGLLVLELRRRAALLELVLEHHDVPGQRDSLFGPAAFEGKGAGPSAITAF